MKLKFILSMLALGVVVATEEESPLAQDEGLPESMRPRFVPVGGPPRYVLMEGPLVLGPKGTERRMFRMDVQTGEVDCQHWFDMGEEKVAAYWKPVLENDVALKFMEMSAEELRALGQKAEKGEHERSKKAQDR